MGYDPPQDIHPIARALIRYKKQPLIGTFGFTRDDADDIEQELALRAHIAAAKYNPRRGSPATFYDRVLENAARSLITHATAQKRNRRREVRFDEDRAAHSPVRDHGLAIDVRDALSSLPSAEQRVATLLIHDTVAGVARRTGMTRGQVRGARGRIAKRLARFSPKSTTTPPGEPVLIR
jgi:RNA polymerase sigma factor (sigma-70 family)